jgi:glutamine synthetase
MREPVSFVRQHELWTEEQARSAQDVVKEIQARELRVVRFSFADQHGILRGKTLVAAEALRRLESDARTHLTPGRLEVID